MALIDEALAQQTVALVARRYQTLGAALGRTPASPSPLGGGDAPGTLLRDLRFLIAIANGEVVRTDERVTEAEAALARVADVLFGTAIGFPPRVPETFWGTAFGVVLSRGRWWVSIDDLITISAAATLAFGQNTQATRMRIARAIEHGALQWVPDPSVANPQQRKRVLRSEVERLRDQARFAAGDDEEE